MGTMGFRAALIKRIKFDELNQAQMDDLKKKFEEHKRELQVAMRAVDGGLKELKAAKKRSAKR
jgi:hypothetical protein